MIGHNQAEEILDWVNKDGSAIVDLGPEIEGVQVWGSKTNQTFQHTLLNWYDKEKRDLPWRRQHEPYDIWVSEIMLQQTQVDTVIPYYARFMHKFPTIADLAVADEDDLLKTWEGLGYYSRVRNMQQAAQQIMADFNGEFPETLKEIQSLKGIGPYTAGAIGSIAFGIPTPAIDGNAMRVFARLFTITADIAIPKNRNIFEEIGQYLIDEERPGDFNQAIMDLGSSYCSAKKPTPHLSPLREYSMSTLNSTTMQYPVKSKKKKAKLVYYQALMIENSQGQYLIEKRVDKKLLNNLWIVPLLEQTEATNTGAIAKQLELLDFVDSQIEIKNVEVNQDNVWENLVAETDRQYNVQPIFMKREVGNVKHVFTHLVWHIKLYYARIRPADEQRLNRYIQTEGQNRLTWVNLHELDKYAFPTVQKKIWVEFQKVKLNK